MTEPSTAVSVSLQTKNNVTCFGANNGGITVTGTGGVGALSYSKDGTTYQLSNSFTALSSGSYTVTAGVALTRSGVHDRGSGNRRCDNTALLTEAK